MAEALATAGAAFERSPSTDVALLKRLLSRAPDDPVAQAPALVMLGALLRRVGEITADIAALDEAVRVGRAAVDGLPPLHPWRASAGGELVNTLLSRFDAAGNRQDVEAAVSAAEAALVDATASPLPRHMFLTTLALAYFRRAGHAGAADELDRAIRVSRDAVAYPDATATAWGNLAVALALRSELGGGGADLDEAISIFRSAWERFGNNGLPQSIVIDCGNSLRTRAQRTGSLADAAEAVHVLTSSGIAGGVSFHSALCGALTVRAELSDDPGDLDGAVEAGRLAIAETSFASAHALSNLGNALVARHERTGGLDDLPEALDALRAAVVAAPGTSPHMGRFCTNLANALRRAHECTGESAMLEEAVEAAERAVAVTPVHHAEYAGYLVNLATILDSRIAVRPSEAEVQRAMDLLRTAIAITGVPEERATAAAALGRAHLARFERLGAHSDLAEAVAAARLGVLASRAGRVRYPVKLLALAEVLRVLSRLDENRSIADEAVEVSKKAFAALASLPPGHRSRTAALSNLGNCLLSRAQLVGSTDGLAEALAHVRQAGRETPADDPARALRAANLALAQFAVLAPNDPDERDAITTALRGALDALAEESPYRAPVLINLGIVLDAAPHDGTPRGGRLAAIGAWRRAAINVTAASRDRLRAAYLWGAAASHAGLAQSAIAGYAYAADLLPQVAWRGLDARGRQHIGAEWQGLSGEAAAAALTVDAPDRAVEMLENTRGIAWTQLLDLRSDLARLAQRDADLADRLTQIRQSLDTRGPEPIELASPEIFR